MTATATRTALPTSSVEIISPETAQEWLGSNGHNRNLRRALVSTYARDMANGRWQFTGDAIKFAVGGQLLDGQHRLHALVEADASLPMLVVRDVPPAAQAVMDSGSKRTAADALSLSGEQSATTLASVALLVITDGAASRKQVSTSEIMAAISTDPSIRWASEAISRYRVTGVTPSVVGYAYWRLSSIDAAAAHSFFDSLSNLVGLPAGSPILALHRRLSNGTGDQRQRSHAYRQETLACIFMAWNAWRKNENRSIIKLAYAASGRLSIPKPI